MSCYRPDLRLSFVRSIVRQIYVEDDIGESGASPDSGLTGQMKN